ncbi:acetyltransferase (GNAT) family protein [Hydrogenispora ethanolica]|uniref:Acetyltransferase (GNAT) family protein n=2 Tax=Hydrogenispora ethanolica TaxID=1082276 RepID=A0A4R1R939_HYDET|nr:acetyltransferase (GNAT) family protein [Hydrogenispora ethanolica]
MGLCDELYLNERARGLGIGKRLLDEVLRWMKERGIARVKLHAYSWNRRAQKIYEMCGFEEYAVSYEKFI